MGSAGEFEELVAFACVVCVDHVFFWTRENCGQLVQWKWAHVVGHGIDAPLPQGILNEGC